MDEVNCPYCDELCEVDHDDGLNYQQDETNEMECPHCDKVFIVSTSILYNHEGHIAPCKNGEDHDWKDIHGFPEAIFDGKKRCSYCDEEKDFLTPEERQKKLDEYRKSLNK